MFLSETGRKRIDICRADMVHFIAWLRKKSYTLTKDSIDYKAKYEEKCRQKMNLEEINNKLMLELIAAGVRKPAIKSALGGIG